MKRNILKLFAIVAAFFVGVSINNSCGESKMETETHGTLRVRDYNDVTIRLSGRYIFICRIGNEKATVYFQPIALEYRISNNLLQDTNIFQNRQIYPKSRCMQKLAF